MKETIQRLHLSLGFSDSGKAMDLKEGIVLANQSIHLGGFNKLKGLDEFTNSGCRYLRVEFGFEMERDM